MQLALIIPYYKGSRFLSSCLNSINEDHNVLKLKVFVIDNDDHDVDIQKDYPFEIEIIKTAPRIGFARAVNLGSYIAIIEAFGNLVILNQDCLLTQDVLYELGSLLIQDGSKIYSPMISDYEDPNQENSVFKGFINSSVSSEDEYEMVPATCWAISGYMVKEKGLFDPTFYHYVEERDFLRRNQVKVKIIKDLKVSHLGATKNLANAARSKFLLYRSRLNYILRYENGITGFRFMLRGLWDLSFKFKNPLLGARIVPYFFSSILRKDINLYDEIQVKRRILNLLIVDSKGRISDLP